MDLTQLEYFQAVARCENITKAAKALYVSQPTLSQSIARLEASLDTELFDRVNGKLRLNEAGRLFLARVDNVFAELNMGFSELDQYKADHQDWVYIASSVIDIFKVIMLEYRKMAPDVHIDHLLTSDRNILDLLLSSKVDFAVTPAPIDEPRIRCEPLFEEELFAVAGACHPLSNYRTASLDLLRSYPLVCNSCDSDIKFIEQIFQTDCRNLDIIASSSESHIPRELTTEGYCIGFIPARVAVRHLMAPGNGQVPIRLSPPVRRTTCISTKCSRQLSLSAQALYRFIIEYCARESKEVEKYIFEYYGY